MDRIDLAPRQQQRGRARRWAGFALLFVLALGLAGFGAVGCKGARTDAINRILNDPASFATRDVTVAGRVVNVFDPTAGLLNLSAYQVEDNTGRIWVISRSGAPRRGQEVGLKARVREEFRLGTEVLGVVLSELDRRTR
jgi:hypothetical protein